MKTSIAAIVHLASALAEAVSDLALKQGSIALSPAKAAGAALKDDLVLPRWARRRPALRAL